MTRPHVPVRPNHRVFGRQRRLRGASSGAGLHHGRFAARPRLLWLLPLLCISAILPACTTYQLRGKVVEGGKSTVRVVDKHDPRLNQSGVPGARIHVVIDPRSLGKKTMPQQATGNHGQFATPIDKPGAGTLEYKMEVTAQAKDYHAAQRILPLPGADKRVLIILAPGQDAHPPNTHDFLDQTMKMGKPYMEE